MTVGLVLSRKEGEVVVIRTPAGEVIRVSVVEVRRGRARLGFLADRSVRIDREEVDADRHGESAA